MLQQETKCLDHYLPMNHLSENERTSLHFSDKHNPTFDVWRGPRLPSPFMDLNHLKEENFVKNDFDYVTQVCYATPLRFLEYQMCSL